MVTNKFFIDSIANPPKELNREANISIFMLSFIIVFAIFVCGPYSFI